MTTGPQPTACPWHNNMNADVAMIAGEIKSFGERIASLETSIDNYADCHTRIDAKLDKLEDTMITQAKQIVSLQSSVKQHGKRIQEWSDTVDELKDVVQGLKAVYKMGAIVVGTISVITAVVGLWRLFG